VEKVFRFIHAEKVNYPVAVLARTLRVNRLGLLRLGKAPCQQQGALRP